VAVAVVVQLQLLMELRDLLVQAVAVVLMLSLLLQTSLDLIHQLQ
jgi:hypothetical protein